MMEGSESRCFYELLGILPEITCISQYYHVLFTFESDIIHYVIGFNFVLK